MVIMASKGHLAFAAIGHKICILKQNTLVNPYLQQTTTHLQC